MSILIPVVLIVLNHFLSSSVALVPGYTFEDGKAYSLLSLLINQHYNIKLTYVRPDNRSLIVEAKPPLELLPEHITQTKQKGLRKSREACSKFMNISYGFEGNPIKLLETENISNSSISKDIAELKAELENLGTEYSHLAALGSIDDNGDFIYQCAGTLIDRDWILTAAHCAQSSRGYLTIVRLGVSNLQRYNTDGETLGIKQIFRHPFYKPPQFYYDIALLKLDRSINFSSSIKPACLYQNSNDISEEMWMGGWSSLEFGERGNEILQKSRMTVFNNNWCSSEIGSSIKMPNGFLSSMICATSPGNDWRYDTCQGALGGPLHIQPPDQDLFTVVGISSFDIDCKVTESPRVFSKVSYFIPWIENIVWPETD